MVSLRRRGGRRRDTGGSSHAPDGAQEAEVRGLANQGHATSSTDVSNSRRHTVEHGLEGVEFVGGRFRYRIPLSATSHEHPPFLEEPPEIPAFMASGRR